MVFLDAIVSPDGGYESKFKGFLEGFKGFKKSYLVPGMNEISTESTKPR